MVQIRHTFSLISQLQLTVVVSFSSILIPLKNSASCMFSSYLTLSLTPDSGCGKICAWVSL